MYKCAYKYYILLNSTNIKACILTIPGSSFEENFGNNFRGLNILPAVIIASMVDFGSLSKRTGINRLYKDESFCFSSVLRAEIPSIFMF